MALPACAHQLPPPALPGASEPTGDASKPEPSTVAPRAGFNDNERQRITYVQPLVQDAAAKHRLDPELINGVIWVESRFNPRARSPVGARGLMQLMPATAAELARKMGRFRAASYDPEFNIEAGSLYLAKLIARYDGNVRLGLAAYNAGAGNVDRWLDEDGKLPPRSEQYVSLVLDAKARFESWHRPPVEVPRDTMIAAKPRCPKAPGCPGPELGTVDQRRRQVDPAPPTGPVPAEPVAVVPDPPVRYDLDRVETNYEPTPASEPPIRDTPLPPRTFEPKPAGDDDSKPRPAGEDENADENEDEGVRVGRGVLPSVLE